MKITLLFIPLILLLSACQPNPPVLSVKADGKALKTYQGSYCWEMMGRGECADSGGPDMVIGDDQPKTAQAGSKAVLSYWGDPDALSIYRDGTVETMELELKDGKAAVTLPEEPGVYVYYVNGSWEQGNASSFFQIEIE